MKRAKLNAVVTTDGDTPESLITIWSCREFRANIQSEGLWIFRIKANLKCATFIAGTKRFSLATLSDWPGDKFWELIIDKLPNHVMASAFPVATTRGKILQHQGSPFFLASWARISRISSWRTKKKLKTLKLFERSSFQAGSAWLRSYHSFRMRGWAFFSGFIHTYRILFSS